MGVKQLLAVARLHINTPKVSQYWCLRSWARRLRSWVEQWILRPTIDSILMRESECFAEIRLRSLTIRRAPIELPRSETDERGC